MPFVKSDARVLLSLGLLLPALAQAADIQPAPTAREGTMAAMPGYALPSDGAPTEQGKTLQTDSAGANPAAPVAGEEKMQPPAEQVAGMGTSMPVEALDQYRGGTSVNSIKSEAVSNGLLQDATATNVATGHNTIADGAFSNAVGLPIVIQNSGANVLIQNSTIVNVQFR